jgi:hypothetical protein
MRLSKKLKSVSKILYITSITFLVLIGVSIATYTWTSGADILTTGDTLDATHMNEIVNVISYMINNPCQTGQVLQGWDADQGGAGVICVDVGSTTSTWPEGSYCIMKAGGSCPSEFTEAEISRTIATPGVYGVPETAGDSFASTQTGSQTHYNWFELELFFCCK